MCIARAKPQRGQDKTSKGLGERNMSLYSVRKYLLKFRQISVVDILMQKMGISEVSRRTGMPVNNHSHDHDGSDIDTVDI